MNQMQVDSILEKSAELRVFCEYGQKTVPMLEDIALFVRTVGPVIEGLRSLVELSAVKIPKASDQLGNVTKAMEQASTDILNTLDRMVATIEQALADTSRMGAPGAAQASIDQMTSSIRTMADKYGWDEDVVRLVEAWDGYSKSLRNAPASNIDRLLHDLQNDCTDISMALQVQDITHQQISVVMGTFHAISDSLQNLTRPFSEGADVEPVMAAPAPAASPVPQPETSAANERKRLVEELLSKARTGAL